MNESRKLKNFYEVKLSTKNQMQFIILVVIGEKAIAFGY